MIKHKLKKHKILFHNGVISITPPRPVIEVLDNTVRTIKTELTHFRQSDEENTRFHNGMRSDEITLGMVGGSFKTIDYETLFNGLKVITKETIFGRNGRVMYEAGEELPFRTFDCYNHHKVGRDTLEIEIDLTSPAVPNDTFDGYEGSPIDSVFNIEVKLIID